MTLSLKVTDKFYKQQLPIEQDFLLRPMSCMNFYDKQTNLTKVLKDIKFERGDQDLYLQYEFETCSSYKDRDPKISFKFADEEQAAQKINDILLWRDNQIFITKEA